jgi:hypothetical protein
MSYFNLHQQYNKTCKHGGVSRKQRIIKSYLKIKDREPARYLKGQLKAPVSLDLYYFQVLFSQMERAPYSSIRLVPSSERETGTSATKRKADEGIICNGSRKLDIVVVVLVLLSEQPASNLE